MEPMRVEGNLASLAAMVRSNARKGEAQALATPAVPARAELPDAARTIANGLSSETLPPLREDGEVDAFLRSLSREMAEDPAQAIRAQGQLHEGRVRNLT